MSTKPKPTTGTGGAAGSGGSNPKSKPAPTAAAKPKAKAKATAKAASADEEFRSFFRNLASADVAPALATAAAATAAAGTSDDASAHEQTYEQLCYDQPMCSPHDIMQFVQYWIRTYQHSTASAAAASAIASRAIAATPIRASFIRTILSEAKRSAQLQREAESNAATAAATAGNAAAKTAAAVTATVAVDAADVTHAAAYARLSGAVLIHTLQYWLHTTAAASVTASDVERVFEHYHSSASASSAPASDDPLTMNVPIFVVPDAATTGTADSKSDAPPTAATATAAAGDDDDDFVFRADPEPATAARSSAAFAADDVPLPAGFDVDLGIDVPATTTAAAVDAKSAPAARTSGGVWSAVVERKISDWLDLIRHDSVVAPGSGADNWSALQLSVVLPDVVRRATSHPILREHSPATIALIREKAIALFRDEMVTAPLRIPELLPLCLSLLASDDPPNATAPTQPPTPATVMPVTADRSAVATSALVCHLCHAASSASPPQPRSVEFLFRWIESQLANGFLTRRFAHVRAAAVKHSQSLLASPASPAALNAANDAAPAFGDWSGELQSVCELVAFYVRYSPLCLTPSTAAGADSKVYRDPFQLTSDVKGVPPPANASANAAADDASGGELLVRSGIADSIRDIFLLPAGAVLAHTAAGSTNESTHFAVLGVTEPFRALHAIALQLAFSSRPALVRFFATASPAAATTSASAASTAADSSSAAADSLWSYVIRSSSYRRSYPVESVLWPLACALHQLPVAGPRTGAAGGARTVIRKTKPTESSTPAAATTVDAPSATAGWFESAVTIPIRDIVRRVLAFDASSGTTGGATSAMTAAATGTVASTELIRDTRILTLVVSALAEYTTLSAISAGSSGGPKSPFAGLLVRRRNSLFTCDTATATAFVDSLRSLRTVVARLLARTARPSATATPAAADGKHSADSKSGASSDRDGDGKYAHRPATTATPTASAGAGATESAAAFAGIDASGERVRLQLQWRQTLTQLTEQLKTLFAGSDAVSKKD